MRRSPFTRPLLAASDVLLLFGCFSLARVPALLLPGHGPALAPDPAPALLRVFFFGAVLWLVNAWQEQLYRLDARDPWDVFFAGVRAALKTGALLLILLFLARIDLDFPRGTVILAWLMAAVLLPLFHMAVQSRLVLRPGGSTRTLLLGGEEGIREYFQSRKISALSESLGVCGIVAGAPFSGAELPLPVLGQLDDLPRIIRETGASRLLICAGHLERARLNTLLQRSMGSVDELMIFPDVAVLELAELEVSHLGSRMVLNFNQNLRSAMNQFVKRSIDVLGSLAGLVVLAPLLLVCCLAISLDSRGWPIYRHRRWGRGMKWIYMIKFRTMVRDSDAVLQKLLAEDENARAEWAAQCKLKNDPRITRVGAFLRRWSLDELPQIINVLVGDMSLVGPRPINEVEYDKYGHWQRNFMSIRPGLTGLWQVSGRSDLDFEDRVRLDMYYIRNWTIWLDLRILIKTLGVVAAQEGAY
ncbi:MAG: exopolysaccharide biosynthesis polyprenyl glycosylphosphotransferase [Calditrichaeota bacterium]|nr:exopolysaccharide biosynthesis polyprenyl glycosylphosphotransferase [Candidatus Cloacimonadota bacterium]MCA9785227.1 exopolysaccharide biosynthesis polyprenyl glycosylphosphotransferase [Candidatus Cloacimonadota bacterium]MCB1046782.1 exopolysaccharide biosynthesis polyprenyl glycosylphosphotransferase [Calditrichota bacterium]MCB9472915.1 exopolysaccharide biosynthesis polyprenyl glycosylphosphotransferase [Candidatus Delongbacteria bacterium]